MPKHYKKTEIGLQEKDKINQSRYSFDKRSVACLLLSIFLEMATLKGARISSPLVVGDWLFARVAVLWVLSMLISKVYSLAVANGHIRSAGRFLADNCQAIIKRRKAVLLSVSISTLVSLITGYFSVIKCGFLDLRLAFASFSVLLSILLIVLNWSEVKSKLEYLFLLFAVPFGLCYCFAMPFIPEVSWDGQIHYKNANCLSYLMNAEFTEADLLMADPYAVVRLGLLGSGDVSSVWNPNQEIAVLNHAQEEAARLDQANLITKCSGFSNPSGDSSSGSYFSAGVIGVLPQAIGLWVGRLFGTNIIGRLLLARIFSLAFYIVVVFYGIKSLKKGKLLVSALALLISPILMASNFSYDPWCYALFIFSTCHYVGKLQEGACSLNAYNVFVILSSFTLGCLAKAVYFPLTLVLLLTPKKYFSSTCSKKRVMLFAGLSMAFLVASFAIPTLVSSLSGTEAPDVRAQTGVSPSGQIRFAFMHPFFVARTMLSFIISFFSTIPVTASLGSYFPYLYNSPDILGYLSWILIIGALLFDGSEKDFSFERSIRISAVLALTISLLLSIAALYAAFTPVGYETVLGYQWRYLIPFYPLIFLIVVSLPKRLSELLYGCRLYKTFPIAFVILELMYQLINLYFGFIVNII